MKIGNIIRANRNKFSQSILLEEESNPILLKAFILVLTSVVFLFLIWTYYMEIDEVAVAKGKIIPNHNISKVQHPDGGVIKDLLVKRGQRVKKDQLLLRFDETIIQSEYKQAEAQLSALKQQRDNVREQLKIRELLYKKGLNSRISYLALQEKFLEFEGRVHEVREVVMRLKTQLNRLEVRAPIDGIIHFVEEHPVGSVIESGTTIFEILPKDRALVAEVKISTGDIGHVIVGQQVTLKFNTYDYGRFGGLIESLGEISPITLLDAEGNPYYRGIIYLSKNHLGHSDHNLPVIPGMTLLAEIKTGKKTILEYLLRPVQISAQNALRER